MSCRVLVSVSGWAQHFVEWRAQSEWRGLYGRYLGSDLKQTRQIVLAAHLHHGDAYAAVHGWMRLRIN
jgi:hypothetical protein